jgi:hypothetical protein
MTLPFNPDRMKDRRAEFLAGLIMQARILPGMIVRTLLPNGVVFLDRCYWVELDRAQKHLDGR